MFEAEQNNMLQNEHIMVKLLSLSTINNCFNATIYSEKKS